MLDLLQKLICFSLDVHIWSGRKKLTPADLGLEGEEIPPEELASLGAKKICHPILLQKFQALRRRAERICEASGVRFLGGYAIPEDKAKEVAADLEKVSIEFEAEKQEFLKSYASSMEEWLRTLPDRWRSMVERAIESPEYVASRISFDFQTFQVTGVEGLSKGLESAANGLGSQLYREIAQAARQAWEASFMGRTKVSQRSLSPIKAILEKAKGLCFIEPGLAKVIIGIEQEIAGLPKEGYMEGSDFHTLVGILNTLADLDKVKLEAKPEAAPQQKTAPQPEAKQPAKEENQEEKPKQKAKPKPQPKKTEAPVAEEPADNPEPESDVDMEEVFAPIPDQTRRQSLVTPPVAWF